MKSESEDQHDSIDPLKKFESLSNSDYDIHLAIALGARKVIEALDNDSYLEVRLNYTLSKFPAESLKTMTHCIWIEDSEIIVLVETAHILKMISWLNVDTEKRLFLDIGAATGAACIPIVKSLTDLDSVIAFEPAQNAHRLLISTIQKNGITNIEVLDCVVSNFVGDVEFFEFGPDKSGKVPYLPETSAIKHIGMDMKNGTSRNVRSTTLDYFLKLRPELAEFGRVVIKIDVEGFEVEVLLGALEFITKIRPYFSIDIHNVPSEKITTLSKCEEILKGFGYTFENLDHVLLATPF